jgi:hypothetical protein
MSNDKFQDKYDEIFQNLKEEKMNWDFDDFLKKQEKKRMFRKMKHRLSIDTKTKPSFPKWFWMAASVVLLLSVGLIFNYNQNSNVENQAQLVENR